MLQLTQDLCEIKGRGVVEVVSGYRCHLFGSQILIKAVLRYREYSSPVASLNADIVWKRMLLNYL